MMCPPLQVRQPNQLCDFGTARLGCELNTFSGTVLTLKTSCGLAADIEEGLHTMTFETKIKELSDRYLADAHADITGFVDHLFQGKLSTSTGISVQRASLASPVKNRPQPLTMAVAK